MYFWDKSFETQNALIDEQHKKLFDALNAFLKASSEKKSRDEVKKSLNFLNDYTIKHFFDEEQLQKQYGYPDYQRHHELHEGLKKTVRELQHDFILNGSSDKLIDDMEKKVGNWLAAHIKNEDVKIGAYIKSKTGA
ncbi:MAG: hemerythrin family protein [Treponema sp.]|jgi:hemerythrin|nr:hemerythrin family protein [Treponema sp.]